MHLNSKMPENALDCLGTIVAMAPLLCWLSKKKLQDCLDRST